ncbi:V-type ATPase subunit [bacterium]|nr:V-type ATPase subunit [bacterium]
MSLNVPLVVTPDSRYSYATGVVRGKWEKRLKRPEFARLIEAQPEELGKTIAELGFQGAETDIELALSEEWFKTIALVESLIDDAKLASLARIYTDFTNLAIAIKAEAFNFDYKPYHLPGGLLSSEEMAELVADERLAQNQAEEEILLAIKEARDVYEKTDLQLTINAAVDSHFATIFKKLLFGSAREFLIELARRWLDCKNFSAYLRLRAANFDIDLFKQFFVEGGHLIREDYMRFEEGEIDAIPSRLVFSIYGKPFADAVADSIKNENFSKLSAFFNKLLEEFLRNSIYVPFGVEVIIAYAFLKHSEIRAVRAIARMKSAKLGKDIIAERIRYGDI